MLFEKYCITTKRVDKSAQRAVHCMQSSKNDTKIYKNRLRLESHVAILCVYLWWAVCCAVCAQSFAESSPQLSRQLGSLSMTLSVAGIAVSVLTVIVIFYSGGFEHHPHNRTATGNSTLDDVRTLTCLQMRQLHRTFINSGPTSAWWSGVVVSALALINEVNQRRARLVLRWATVSGFNSRCRTFISVCNQPATQGQFSRPSLRGR